MCGPELAKRLKAPSPIIRNRRSLPRELHHKRDEILLSSTADRMGFLIPRMLELRGVGFREFLRDVMLYFPSPAFCASDTRAIASA